jgi:glutaminase
MKPLTLVAGALLLLAGTAVPARGPIGSRDADLQMAVTQAHKRYQSDRSGKISDAVPALSRVSPDLYGVVVVRIDGKIYEAGDTRIPFVLGASAAPFTAALVVEQQGADTLVQKIGVSAGPPSATASATAVDNPLSWDGSIATLSLVDPKHDADAKWRALLGNLGAFAGNELFVDESIYRSAVPVAAQPVQDTARQLAGVDRLFDDVDITANLYVKQATVAVTARDLAIMAATLANGGINPVNGRKVVGLEVSQNIQALITNAGMREGTGAWMYKVGIPASAGKGGGIIAIVPGRMGIATFSPPLDAGGISVRGQRAIRYLAQALQVNLYPNWR